MQDGDLSVDRKTDSSTSKGFSNRREQQKAEAIQRQKSKQAKEEFAPKAAEPETEVENLPPVINSLEIKPQGPLKKVSNPTTLEKLKAQARTEKEKRLMAAKQVGFPLIDQAGKGLPLIEKVAKKPALS